MASTMTWQPNTNYDVDFIVLSPNGELMRCILAHKSAATWGSFGTTWASTLSSRTQGAVATSAVAGANAGTTPPAPVVTAGANDVRGNITAGTGTTPAAGAQVVVTFGRAYDVAPIVACDGANQATAALGVGVSGVSTTGFTIVTGSAPAASQANTIYSFNYVVTP